MYEHECMSICVYIYTYAHKRIYLFMKGKKKKILRVF
jgi:hypothetical protein